MLHFVGMDHKRNEKVRKTTNQRAGLVEDGMSKMVLWDRTWFSKVDGAVV
jgi:hypothetical protein